MGRLRPVDIILFIVVLYCTLVLLSGCGEKQSIETFGYRETINNLIVDRCHSYRNASQETQEEIKRSLQLVVSEYYGRLDRDAEYCLNTMEIAHN